MNESDQRRPKHSRVHGANVSLTIWVSLGCYLPSLRNIDPVSPAVCAAESPDLLFAETADLAGEIQGFMSFFHVFSPETQ